MPRVAMIAMHGFRVRRAEMLALGMTLPGLAARANALGGLPALGLLTLAGMTPASWEVSYHEAPGVESGKCDARVAGEMKNKKKRASKRILEAR